MNIKRCFQLLVLCFFTIGLYGQCYLYDKKASGPSLGMTYSNEYAVYSIDYTILGRSSLGVGYAKDAISASLTVNLLKNYQKPSYVSIPAFIGYTNSKGSGNNIFSFGGGIYYKGPPVNDFSTAIGLSLLKFKSNNYTSYNNSTISVSAELLLYYKDFRIGTFLTAINDVIYGFSVGMSINHRGNNI
jgi:hypothetical protein